MIACKKIILRKWGTWDSNPGPEGKYTIRLPPRHVILIVSIIGINNNIKNKTQWSDIKNNTPRFEWTSGSVTRLIPDLPTVAKNATTYTNRQKSVATTLLISKILHRPQKWTLRAWLNSSSPPDCNHAHHWG